MIAALLGGCGNSGKFSPDECSNDAWALSKLLESADRDTVPVMSINLVTRTDLPKVSASPHVPVVLVGKYIVVQGRITEAADLVLQLSDVRDRITSLKQAGIPQHGVLVAIDATATWSEVVAVTDALHAAYYDEPSFVFARPRTTPAPPRSDVDAKLDAVAKSGDLSVNVMETARLLNANISKCPSLKKLFNSVGGVEGNKDAIVIQGVGPALIECSCKVDMPGLRSILWRMFTGNQPTSAVQTTLATDGTAIELAGDTPWSEA
ncbi:MAG TPA: hypothetical protein VGO00_20620, partial [Kofleriaceae bacterium]|nr:hypothetical protein [Kofleriaceae bacterium]